MKTNLSFLDHTLNNDSLFWLKSKNVIWLSGSAATISITDISLGFLNKYFLDMVCYNFETHLL